MEEIKFSHVSVLLRECIEQLNIKPDGIYVDCTAGGGGHSLEIVKRLTDGGSYGADGAETERIESSASGFMKKSGGMLQLQYVEAESSGFGGTKTTVSLCGDMVAVNRSGQLNTHMIFEAGKSHDCVYDTGYFPMQLRVSTKSLDCDITELGGKLNIDYTVEIVGNVAEQSKLTLSVAPDSSVMTS